MHLILIHRHRNIDVVAYSRLPSGQSVADCLNRCRANQECYSFNYNKLTKWCYISTSEELNLKQVKNSKWAAGVRRCVDHVGNAPWSNGEFTGGAAGTEPTAPTLPGIADATTANTINWSYTAPSTAGTTADGTASAIASYRFTCSAVSGNSAFPTIVKSYPTTAGALTCVAATVGTGCTIGGLALTTYSCTLVAINNEGLESPPLTFPSVLVA
jgi:hypothetical protein